MSLGEPVDLSRFKGRVPSQSTQARIRRQVAESIEDQLRELLLLRTQRQANDSWVRKLLT